MRQRLLHSSADRLKEKYKSCKSNGRYIPDEMQMKTLEKPAFELFEGFLYVICMKGRLCCLGRLL